MKDVLVFAEAFLEGCCGVLFIGTLFPDRRKQGLIWQLFQGIVFFSIVVLNAWNMRYGFLSITIVFLAWIMYAAYIILVFRIPMRAAFAWELLYSNSCMMLKTMILLMAASMDSRSILEMNMDFSCSQILFAIMVMALVSGGLYYVYQNKNLRYIAVEILKRRSYMLTVVGVIEFLLVIFIFNISQYDVGPAEIVTGYICILFIVIVLYAQLVSTQYQIMNKEKTILCMQKNMAEQQVLFLKKPYEDSRKKLHSRKYELQYLLDLLKKEDIDKARIYIEDALQQAADLQAQIIYTGQTELDSLVTVFRQKCVEKKVDFQVQCNILYELPVDMKDMYVLMGNLLDNALEAAEKCSGHSPYVKLTLKLLNGMLLLKVSNSYLIEPVQNADGSLQSSKQGLSHGWGLESVRDIVQQNEGTIDIEFAGNRFDVTILI